MSDFKAKMHQIRFLLTTLGAHGAPPDLAPFMGPNSKGRERSRERKGKRSVGGKEGREKWGEESGMEGWYCVVLWTLLHSFIAFLVLLSWLYNLAFWLQFLINLLTYLLMGGREEPVKSVKSRAAR